MYPKGYEDTVDDISQLTKRMKQNGKSPENLSFLRSYSGHVYRRTDHSKDRGSRGDDDDDDENEIKKKKWGGGEKKNNNLFKIVYRNSVIPVSVYKFTSIYIYPLAYTLTTTYVTFFLHASVSFKLYMWVCARVYVCVCMRVCTLSKL